MASSCLQKMQRAALTVFIMFVMVGSLIFCSAPVVVCILDVVLPYALLSSFRYCCCGFKLNWTTYSFGSSLVDIPFISLLRSMSILCVYSIFDAPSLSFGPYLWTALLCGIVSSMIIIVKACLFMVYSALEGHSAESRESHLKQSRGMLTILLLSLVLALGHIVVAYRIRCKVWRKMLLFHQLDPEAATLLVGCTCWRPYYSRFWHAKPFSMVLQRFLRVQLLKLILERSAFFMETEDVR